MLRDLFMQYIKVSRGVSDRSVGHYITGLNSINSILKKYNVPITDVFHVTNQEELNMIDAFLKSNEEFLTKDSIGHNMYSVAFKHFYRFACEDNAFFSQHLRQMDVPVGLPKISATKHTTWKRNQIIVNQAIEGANYICENNNHHITFTSKITGMPYMEGHHIIPMKYQKSFSVGLDVYANVLCLCPTCHRLFHHGVEKEKREAGEKIYDIRKERLISSGIDLSKKDFLSLVL